MAEDTGSEASVVSEHYANAHPELDGQNPPVYTQTHHPLAFKRLAMTSDAAFEQAWPGSLEMVSSLNPDYFTLPYGTRIVNIKTEYTENVLYSIQQSLWTTLRPISERIMQIWD
ncbi:hypothetical protein LTR53_018335, partial [Teratosphaeriaceae sp. CCFEE 6253]